ncbi:hypothetical protein M0R45_020973 [Rubus argutus]|uniref:Initiation factor eIF2 gamma C-terminal domain-containing protein n=1 Tax=Rubus argutus TaxID=59490 RepID=A0AAW1XBP9_RUBAR
MAVGVPVAQGQVSPSLGVGILINGTLSCSANLTGNGPPLAIIFNEIRGGVAGGSILRGVLKVNQYIEVRPGIVVKDESGNIKCTPIVSLYAEQNELQFALLQLLGVRTKGSEKQGKVSKLAKAEILELNIGSMSTGARVIAVRNDLAKLQLTSPVCTSKGEKIALSRRVEKHWRLIGWGQIQAGSTLEVPPGHI